MGYIGNQSTGITYTNINTFKGKLANLTALSAASGMMSGDVYITEDNNHAHMYTGTAWVDLGEIRGAQGLVGPQGPQGPQGIAGAGVSTVVRTTGDGSAGTTDMYTITYNDATTSTFSVYNGIDGTDGMPGIIDHVTQTAGDGTQGTTDIYTMYADAAETQILGTFNVYNGYDGVASTVDSLVDVDLTTVPVGDGQTIVWNEVEGKWMPGDVSSSAIGTTYDNTTSGLTATDIQGAIDEIENSIVKLTGDQTIEDVKTFSSDIVGNITGNSGTATNLQTARIINGVSFDGSADITIVDNTKVSLSGNETIEDVKTFTSSPIVPTPSTDFQVATKKYVDDNIGNQSSTDYYQGPYGISWDYATDTYIRTGAKNYTAIQSLMRRCVVKADGTVNYYLNPNNSNFKEDGTSSVLTGADGNVMVEIPKHYIKDETVGNVDSLNVSLTPETGYVLDPAFLKWNGTEMVEVPYRYFRAYEGFVSGGKLLSVSGVTPTITQTIATFRTQAMANGAGWHLTDWNLLNTIKRLCYIEFCDFIVTKHLGEGNYAGGDYGITTGQSNALGNRSSNSTHNDKYMSYRGIENMYADIWEFVDGVNVNNYQFYVNGKYSTFQSDVFTGDYVAKGPLTVAGASNSLIKRCAVSVDGGFIPTVVGGSTTTFYGDALWSATGARIALYSGSANFGASDGLGALIVSSASSYSGVDAGAAVCR